MFRLNYLLIFSFFLLLVRANAAEDEEFRFNKADGLKLLIYDDYVAPQGNKVLANYHNVEYIIDGNGYVHLGAFGDIYVHDLTVDKVTELFKEKFHTYGKELTIIVIPLIRLVLRGEFGTAGMYRVAPTTSFWDLVSQAGGITNSFDSENMYIMRDGEILYTNFMESLYEGTSLAELGLKSGDEIVAPRIARVSFDAIMRYVNFFASLILLYYAINRKQ